MVVVAVAGGTGAVGRTIVKALLDSHNHTVFVLSRTRGTSTADPQYLALDYSDVNQIESVLRKNGITVVISAMVLLDDHVAASQINLIRGAARSAIVNKFIPTEFHIDFNAEVEGIELAFKKFQLEAIEELKRHPQLTWSLVRNGLFLDYLGMPYTPLPTNMLPWSVFIDMRNEMCVLPGDGMQVVTFTHSLDLASFIERLVSLPADDWPRESLVMPNKLRLNELVKIVRQVTGRDFRVIYDSAKAIQNGHITPLPANKQLFADPSWGEIYQLVEKEAMFTVLSNGYDLHGKDLADIFPGVQTTHITDFLRQSWTLKQAEVNSQGSTAKQ